MLNAVILEGQLLLLVFLGFLGAPIFRLFGKLGGLDVIFPVFLLESLYSAGGVDVFLLAGIERMAHRADFGVDFLDGTAGLERIAAAAMDHYLIVFWMYSFFHNLQFSRYLQSRILTL
jgi:hypothetical protein